MATPMQVAAVQELVEQAGSGRKISVSRAMRESKLPYSPKTAKTPQRLTDSKGFKEVCDEYGLTDSLILGSLTADIKAKPRNRVQELSLAAKIKGLLVDRSENKNFNLTISLRQLLKEAEKENE